MTIGKKCINNSSSNDRSDYSFLPQLHFPDFFELQQVLAKPRACTFQVEEHRHAALLVEFRAFRDSDRRRVAFANVDRYSMQFVTGWPDYDFTLSNLEWEIGTARVPGVPFLLTQQRN